MNLVLLLASLNGACHHFHMSDRQMILDLVSKLPDDAPLEEILRNIDLVAGIQRAREQARRGQGIPAEDARELVRKWASQSS